MVRKMKGRKKEDLNFNKQTKKKKPRWSKKNRADGSTDGEIIEAK